MIKIDYPTNWPGAFQEVLSLSFPTKNQPLLFLRILTSLVDEVVSFQEGRTKEEISSNSSIKDAMRGIPQSQSQSQSQPVTSLLFEAMINIIATTQNTGLAQVSLLEDSSNEVREISADGLHLLLS